MAYAVEMRKVAEYLLSETHPVGRHKAVVFRALGYDAQRPSVLADDLLLLAEGGVTRSEEPSAFGVVRVVGGTLQGPNGRGRAFITVWILANGGSEFRLVTAYPE